MPFKIGQLLKIFIGIFLVELLLVYAKKTLKHKIHIDIYENVNVSS